jgi:hypothetical protein
MSTLMSTLLDLPTRTEAIDALRTRARVVALRIDRLAFADAFVLKGAVRERLGRAADLALSERLRPLLNQMLDIVDVSWLEPAEAEQLERAIFAADRRSVRTCGAALSPRG